MKKILLMVCLTLGLTSSAFSQSMPSGMPGKPPSSLNNSKANPFAKPQEKPEPINMPKKLLKKPVVEAKGILTPFSMPGMVGVSNGQWTGSDNLYNLTPFISLYVEIIKPENSTLAINEKDIIDNIEKIFGANALTPHAMIQPGDPALPLYHVLIMYNKAEEYEFGLVNCRLFEPVNLKRVILEDGISFQAITWEKQELVAASDKDFKNIVISTVDELTNDFVTRFRYFQEIKARSSGDR
jgi:hypothetical protein